MRMTIKSTVVSSKKYSSHGTDVIKNDGTDLTNREHNFGITAYNYQVKPAFNSIKIYNELLKDRNFEEHSTSGSVFLSTFENQAKYKDDITGDYTYRLYNGKNKSGSKIIPLSGNIAYLYDYQGNIVNTYTNTNQSITVKLNENPQFVHCVSYKTSIEDLEYDANKNGVYYTADIPVSFRSNVIISAAHKLYGEIVTGRELIQITDADDKGYSHELR